MGIFFCLRAFPFFLFPPFPAFLWTVFLEFFGGTERVKMLSVWVWWSFAASLAWGGAYAFLRPTGPISPWVVQILYGLGSAFLNTVGMFLFSPNWRQDWTSGWRQEHLYLLGYIFLNSIAGFAYMAAAQYASSKNVATITAISSTYPVITTLILFLVYKEYRNVDLSLAIPGLALAATGCALLAIAPRPTQ